MTLWKALLLSLHPQGGLHSSVLLGRMLLGALAWGFAIRKWSVKEGKKCSWDCPQFSQFCTAQQRAASELAGQCALTIITEDGVGRGLEAGGWAWPEIFQNMPTVLPLLLTGVPFTSCWEHPPAGHRAGLGGGRGGACLARQDAHDSQCGHVQRHALPGLELVLGDAGADAHQVPWPRGGLNDVLLVVHLDRRGRGGAEKY